MPLREVLSRWAIVPRRRFGQNFLHDPAVAARVAEAATVGPDDHVLEIGPGLGALTRPLLASGARVTAIEVDRRIAAFLRDELSGRQEFTLREADILEVDLEALASEGALLVANLPYSITAPILRRLLDLRDRLVDWSVMVQREVADRLLAAPGTRAYGSLTVLHRVIHPFDLAYWATCSALCRPGVNAVTPT